MIKMGFSQMPQDTCMYLYIHVSYNYETTMKEKKDHESKRRGENMGGVWEKKRERGK